MQDRSLLRSWSGQAPDVHIVQYPLASTLQCTETDTFGCNTLLGSAECCVPTLVCHSKGGPRCRCAAWVRTRKDCVAHACLDAPDLRCSMVA